MNVTEIYAKIQSQLDTMLPFVIYRKPGEHTVQCWLQNDDQLYALESFETSGFVFAPFDNTHTSVVFPTEQSTQYSVELSSKVKKQTISTSVSSLLDPFVNSKEAHIQLVNKGIEYISEGSIQKVVLSRKEEVVVSEHTSVEIFKGLIASYPNAFVYYWYHPKVGNWLGATPEKLVTIQGDLFFTMALAGTQPYKGSLEVDWGNKEVEEQAMVTKFVLNQLESKTAYIEKSNTYTHKAGSLLHLRTDIKGVLNTEGFRVGDIISVLHPTPAVCGLPKEKARSFILNNEPYDRKYYTGFLGELNIQKNETSESNIYVNLRCMELESGKAIMYVGGGITKDSNAEKEWEETIRKTETMKKVLR